jgi:hypothetical protein
MIPTPPRASWWRSPAVEAVQDGRIHIEKINGPFLFKEDGSPAEYGADRARLALDARKRDLCEIHPGRRRDVCLKRVGTKGLVMRSEVHAMAATVFICAAASISHASAHPSTVASPPTEVSASRHHPHHRRYESYRAPPHLRCQYHYFPRYEWNPGCGYWWDYL